MKRLLFLCITLGLLAGNPVSADAQTYKHKHKVKRGMSRKTKATLIGAGSGAIIGGVAHGGKGAVVGTAVGAGTGYLIARHKDKKHPKARRIKVKDKVVRR